MMIFSVDGSALFARVRRNLIASDDRAPGRGGGVVDVEVPVVPVVGIERKAEKPLLVAPIAHPATNIEKGLR